MEDIEKIFFPTTKVEFIDRKTLTNEEPVDVIIPKETILFLESYIYLSNPQYFAIAPKLGNYYKIYLYINNKLSSKVHGELLNKKEILHYFDKYIELESLNIETDKKWKNYITILKSIRTNKKRLMDFLDKINPKAIISCTDGGLNMRIIILWCKKRKIPSIIIQPAFIYRKKILERRYSITYRLKYLIINRILGIPRYAKNHIFGQRSNSTYLFLWGEFFNIFPKRKNVFLTGNPAFDKFFEEFSPKRAIRKKAVICTQAIDLPTLDGKEAFQQVNDIYREAMKSKPEIDFYIKVHPKSETIEKYEKIFDKEEFPNFKILQHVNLNDLLKKCDVQISIRSYTSLEAIVTGLPIILVNPNNSLKAVDYFCGEIKIKVTKPEEIGKALDLALSEKYWKEFLERRESYCKKMLYSADGLSSKRVVDLVRKIICKCVSRIENTNKN